MFRRLATPDRLFDRPWHKGHPFCRRTSRLRRAAMFFVLLLLGTVIGGYIYLTDSQRVRGMAESYLSGLIGGRVDVGSATLSIFEGLRLDDVRVRVDAEGDAPDSLLFTAQTFVIRYNLRSMLAGRLEATQIVVQKPFVHLAEDLDNNTWNWHRLGANRPKKVRPKTEVPHAPPPLPELLLRNARVEISEIRSGHHATLGSLTIDGQLSQVGDTPGRYAFDLQSRGVSDGVGPFASGTIATGTGEVSARLMNFEFGRDIRSILPAEVRMWWERHELAGRVNIPVLSYTPPRDGARAKFRVETELNGVTLTIPPEEWLSSEDGQRLADTRGAISLLQNMRALAGYRVDDPASRRAGWSEIEEAAANQPMDVRILNAVGPIESDPPIAQVEPDTSRSSAPDRLAGMLRRFPVKLQSVAGRFLFTEDGIEVRDVGGRVENNGLKIRGRIFGYRPDSTVALRISSFDTENLTIPAAPRYINSLPPQVRELYNQLRPQGTGRLTVDITRPSIGERPVVSGQLEIIDGSFVFDKFPYPLRKATGRILFGRDPVNGLDRVAIERLRGRGIDGGPNRDAIITIDGRIEPLGPTAGVNISVWGTNVSSEDALKQAFPPEVRDALKIFDPENTGRYPTFHGGFVSHIVRPLGYRTPWSFDTDITLDDAAGMLAAFPYPLKHVSGTLQIRNGYVDIIDAAAKKGDASLAVNGRVAWGGAPITGAPPTTGPALPPVHDPFRLPNAYRPKTALTVAVRNMPIDRELIAALPADRRAWLQNAKLSGRVDVDGSIFEVPPPPAAAILPTDNTPRVKPLDYEFAIAVHDATASPLMGDFSLSGLNGKLHLTSKQLQIQNILGKRGGGQVSLDGSIDWSGESGPLATLAIVAKQLPLDLALFEALPKPAQDGWREIEPAGKIDAEITYKGRVDAFAPAVNPDLPASSVAVAVPVGPPAPVGASKPKVNEPPLLKTVVRPQGVTMKLKSIPYPLEGVTGTMTVENGIVRLQDIRARHGKGTIAVAGTGTLGLRPNWDIQLAAAGLPIDDELRNALPPALTTLIDSLKMKGTLGVDFSKLLYRYPVDPSTVASASGGVPTVSLNDSPTLPGPDIDLAANVMLNDGSLDAGVPLTDVQGRLNIAGTVRDGHLAELKGGIDVASMKLAGRDIKNFHSTMTKPADRTELRMEKMTGALSGGELAGSVRVNFPDVGPSRYAAEMVLRGADVKQFAAADTDTNLKGSLTASLSLEGNWNDASARRGRGDVVVTGKEMYRVPLLLGLSQVTNLTLPISSPFNQATARYSLQGQQVAFDVIELKSPTMTMTGEGHLDFGTKEVALSFVTDNPKGLKVPFINDILQGARQELLKINIRGTVQEPKVSAGVMSTFSTTVDEVFKGDPPAKTKKKK